MKNTIYALSTLYGKSAIAVIRVSGDGALLSFEKLTQKKNPITNKTIITNLYDNTKEVFDKAVVLYFPKNKSYTNEDLVEYHVHGSIAVINNILSILDKMPDHRLAQRGEFTKRAFLNGKINLVESESVLDLINAQTTLQAKQALRSMGGDINKTYEFWYNGLLESLALIEATIDFSDQDIPNDLFDIVNKKINDIHNQIKSELKKSENDKIKNIKNGFKIAILGAPNVGKSSLINYLSSKDVAIVSPIEGTTRDVIEVFLDINGIPVSLYDTAGIRISEDEIEIEGIKRALMLSQEADIKILVVDSTNLKTYEAIQEYIDNDTFILLNKIDLVQEEKVDKANNKNIYTVSILHNQGLEEFKQSLSNHLIHISGISESPIIIQQRHKEIIANCNDQLILYSGENYDIITKIFHLRSAINSFEQLFGNVNVEAVLGLIFNKFCIGK